MKTKGFTLLEILIAVAIIGILAALAVPQYGHHVSRARLVTAQSDLELLALQVENRYQRLLSYPGSALAGTAAVQAAVSGWSPASDAADFVFSTDNASASTYTLVATGVAGTLENCTVSLSHVGARAIGDCDSFAADGKWL